MRYSFSSDVKQGAVAVLSAPAIQEKVLPCTTFESYISRHSAAWHNFARSRNISIKPDDIVLVSGWVKTSEWALAAFSNNTSSHKMEFSGDAGGFAALDFCFTVTQDTQSSVDQRAGPVLKIPRRSPELGAGSSPQTRGDIRLGNLRSDQCLFLRYYKQRRRPLGAFQVKDRPTSGDIHDEMVNKCQCTPYLNCVEFFKRCFSKVQSEPQPIAYALNTGTLPLEAVTGNVQIEQVPGDVVCHQYWDVMHLLMESTGFRPS